MAIKTEFVEHVGGGYRESVYDVEASNKNYLQDVNPPHRNIAGDYYLRIGDCQFFIPPEFINVRKESRMARTGVIRQSETTKVKTGQSDTIIDIQFWFANEEQINGFQVESPYQYNYYVDGLRPLIAQFKRQPILPIVNYFLNEVMRVDVVALLNLNFSTVEGFPGLIQASLTLYKTTVEPYIEKPDWTYDQHFMYPVFRWYYNQMLVDSNSAFNAGSNKLKTLKLKDTGDLTNDFSLMYINEAFLMENNYRNSSKNGELKTFDINDVNKSDDYYINFQVDKDKFKCTGIMVSLGNVLAPIRMDMKECPAFQYIGGMDTQIVCAFEVEDEETLTKLNILHNTLERYSREYRDRQVVGFIKIKNQIINMAGVYYAMINDITVATVPNTPHSYRVEITFISFNSHQYYESRVKGMTGFEITEKEYDEIMGNRIGFRGTKEYLDEFTDSKGMIKKDVNYYLRSPWWITEEGLLEGVMDTLELYPDLALPTYKMYNGLITDINRFRKTKGFKLLPVTKISPPMYKYKMWNDFKGNANSTVRTKFRNENLFVDPDFYFCYPAEKEIIGIEEEMKDTQNGMGLLNKIENESSSRIGDLNKDYKYDGRKIPVGRFYDEKSGKLRNYGPEEYLNSIKDAKTKFKGWLKDADADLVLNEKVHKNPEEDKAKYKEISEKIKWYKALIQDSEKLIEENKSEINATNMYKSTALIETSQRKLGLDIIKNPNEKQIKKYKELLKKERDKLFNSEATSRYLNKDQFIKASFHDEMKYNKKGRMVRAFPTYSLLFVDEGIWVDYRRLWNNYFSYHSIVSIDITRERMQPAHTAIIQLQNIYGALNRKSKIDAITKSNISSYPEWTSNVLDLFNIRDNIEFYRKVWLPVIDENMVKSRLQQIKSGSVYLKTGARVHLRMGYGSIPSMMPTVFNGVITEIDTGDIVTAVCQSDGVELINPHHEWAEDARVTWYSLDVEPSEFLHAIMIDREGMGGWLANAKMGLLPELASTVDALKATWKDALTSILIPIGGLYYYGWKFLQTKEKIDKKIEVSDTELFFARFGKRSRYGIEHFGNIVDSGEEGVWRNIGSFLFSENHGLNGYDACKNIYAGNGIGIFDSGYEDVDIDLTEVNAMQSLNEGATSPEKRKKINNYLNGVNEDSEESNVTTDEKNVYFWLSDKSPWDVFQFFASITPEYETRVFEHGFRSTIFWGKPCWLVKTGYYYLGGPKDSEKSYGEEIKIAQQLFLIDSNVNIISNNIKASKDEIATVVVPVYSWDEDPTALSAIFADRSIKRELQKTEIVETSVLQDYPALDWVVTGTQNLFGYNTGMQTAAYEAGRTHMIWKMREMYQGEVYVLGSPAIKEGDGISLNDMYRDLYGNVEVGRITHSFSLESGFISAIKPELIVAIRESINRNTDNNIDKAEQDEINFEKTRRFAWWMEVSAVGGVMLIRASIALFRIRFISSMRSSAIVGAIRSTIVFIRDIRRGWAAVRTGVAAVSSSIPVAGWLALLVEIPIFILVELAFRVIEFMFRSWEAGIIIYPLWHKRRPYVSGIDGYTTLLGGLKDPHYYGEVEQQDLRFLDMQEGPDFKFQKNTSKIKEQASEIQLYYPTGNAGIITSQFGLRKIRGRENFHNGTDYGTNNVNKNNNIYAMADGVVVHFGNSTTMGNYIIIKHDLREIKIKKEFLKDVNILENIFQDDEGVIIVSTVEGFSNSNIKRDTYNNAKNMFYRYDKICTLNNTLSYCNQDYRNKIKNGKFVGVQVKYCYTIYEHLKNTPRWNVTKNQNISGGTIIGIMGNTGSVDPVPNSTNPKAGTHLHFGISVVLGDESKQKKYYDGNNLWTTNSVFINPALFLDIVNNTTNSGVFER